MLLMSLLAGSVIGIERQWRKKLAGIRTMALVSIGATIFVSLSSMMVTDTSPTRIASQVVSGIGFLAGGIILRDGFSVTGLNTAATLWCTAAIGAMIGASFIKEGLLAAVVIMLVNVIIRFFSKRIDKLTIFHNQQETSVPNRRRFIVVGKKDSEDILRTAIINQLDLYNLSCDYFICENSSKDNIQLQVGLVSNHNIERFSREILMHLSKNEHVEEAYQL